jgi:hypothetical protein
MIKSIIGISLSLITTLAISDNLWNCPPSAACTTDQFSSCEPSADLPRFDPHFVGNRGAILANQPYRLTVSTFVHGVGWAICDYEYQTNALVFYTYPGEFPSVEGKNWSYGHERNCTDFINCKFVLPLGAKVK